jgi:uncharacterized cupredoxin-like copper-binding protein
MKRHQGGPPAGIACALAIASLLAVAAPACTSQPPRPTGAVVRVIARDFRFTLSRAVLSAGTASFQVHSRGPSTHEFVVVRTSLPDDHLPLKADGLTVDEDSGNLGFIDEIADIDIGDSPTLDLRLAPGRYVVFCNLEGHYLGGMHVSLEVQGNGPNQ